MPNMIVKNSIVVDADNISQVGPVWTMANVILEIFGISYIFFKKLIKYIFEETVKNIVILSSCYSLRFT